MHAASGAIVSACVDRRSTPAIEISRSSPASGEDLLVQQRVAGVGAEHLGSQLLGTDRGQDPDHHHVRADRPRPLLGGVEARPRVALEIGEHVAVEQPRRDVDLHVELPEFGLERRVGDRLQRGGVDQRRLARVVGEVQLDLEPERPRLRVEPRLGQHPREHVEVRPHLHAVALPVLAAEGSCSYLLAHEAIIPCRAPALQLRRRDLGTFDQ